MAETTRLTSALADRYRIERELGQGGMATVYLAQDLKHDRKVAIKVLRPELAAVIGADRFLSEIKTTANLQHPHILPLFDSGAADSFLFYVMPFVEGESLRDRLNREKQLPISDAIRIATEVAGALDYAHRHNVIHRDIKPENVLLHDGRALVADFGIALAASKAGGSRMTETGMSLGTPTYMSPEQAMGEREITARSDVYALGAMTYEMLLGEPPFTGPTAQSIVAKVMTEKPASLIARRERIPPQVEDAVLTALEKLPADRFASAAEFGHALTDPHFGMTERPLAGSPRSMRRSTWGVVAVVGAAIAVAAFLLGRRASHDDSLDGITFVQRTFADEAVLTARFTRDGETMVYSAAAEGSTPRIFIIRSDYPESRPLSEAGTHLLSVSSRDEMAVLVNAVYVAQRLYQGTLARVPLGGGAPRELLADVREADWSPDGAELAIIHEVNGKDRLEYPIGTVVFESSGYVSDLRISPTGDKVAFLEHPRRWDDRGGVAVVDRHGRYTSLTEGYWGLQGLAWASDGARMFFSGALESGFYQAYSVTLGGTARLVLPSAGSITVQDMSPAGRLLLTRDEKRNRMLVKAPGARSERDLSWMDLSRAPKLSGDGGLIAFENDGADAGTNYATMIRKSDGSPAVRLGEGGLLALSSDKRWVLSAIPTKPQRLMLYPTGAGQSRLLDSIRLESYVDALFFPDGVNLLVCGNEQGHAVRCYVRQVGDGPLRALTPEGTREGVSISPDGQTVLAATAEDYRLYPLGEGAPRAVPGLSLDDLVVRWSPDGRALWIASQNEIPLRVSQLDLASGQRRPLLSIGPENRAGVLRLNLPSLADDPRVYAYIAREYVSRIFVVAGVK